LFSPFLPIVWVKDAGGWVNGAERPEQRQPENERRLAGAVKAG